MNHRGVISKSVTLTTAFIGHLRQSASTGQNKDEMQGEEQKRYVPFKSELDEETGVQKQNKK